MIKREIPYSKLDEIHRLMRNGIYDFKNTYSGTDLYPLHDMGIPAAELVPDSQRYFDIHHTEEDTFEKVNRRELLLGAVAMTQLIYMIDKNW